MTRIGILGGGQLGRMFIQNALNYPVEIHIMDPNPDAPCSKIAHKFAVGDFNKKEDVLAFAKDVDILGIEIEHVNLEALIQLKAEGKTVIPDPDVLAVIQDKGIQKEFYIRNNIATAPEKNSNDFPVIQKLRKGGYDGKGVQLLLNKEKASQAWEEPSIFEEVADIDMELAVIVARNESGQTTAYPVVEQVFNQEYNLLDYLLTPARISDEVASNATKIAMQVVDAFDSPGIYAIELFLNKDGSLWVNETAPRVHNSGHSTIEASYTSQFDMMLRVLMNYPLGSPELMKKSAMLNIIGAENETGNAKLDGMFDLLNLSGDFVHWYGKSITKPGRKMGHATFLGDEFDVIIANINKVKDHLKAIED